MKTIYLLNSYGLIFSCFFLITSASLAQENINSNLSKTGAKDSILNNWHRNPNAFRNFIGPTAYGPDLGSIQYQNYLLVINQINLSVGQRFSLGMGVELVSLLEDTVSFPSAFLNAKYSIPVRENFVNLAVGGIFIHSAGATQFFDFGGFYFAATLGPRDRNVTGGVGFGILNGDFAPSPFFLLNGNWRLSSKIGFISDNWIIPDLKIGLLSLGVRIIGRKLNWDFALFGTRERGGFFQVSPLPLMGIGIPLGIPLPHSPN